MPIIRIPNNQRVAFTIIENSTINNQSINCKIFGFHTRLLSHPKNWQFSVKNIAKKMGLSERTIQRYLKVLIDNGYCIRHRNQVNEYGFPTITYSIFENKISKNNKYSTDESKPHIYKDKNIYINKKRKKTRACARPKVRAYAANAAPPPKPPASPAVSESARYLSSFFSGELKKQTFNYILPSAKSSDIFFEKMLQEGRTVEEIKLFIGWAYQQNKPFWQIRSAKELKNKFTHGKNYMEHEKKQDDLSEINRKYGQKIETYFETVPHSVKNTRSISAYGESLVFESGMTIREVKYNENGFKEQANSILMDWGLMKRPQVPPDST